MSNARKRFWKAVDVASADGGYAVQLDGRPIKTPAKAPLIVPTRRFAALIAAEWDAQADKIDPETMPATRAANAALDKVSIQFNEVADMLTAYGETDLLCYRAEAPAGLIERQAAAWDPLLDWAANRFEIQWNVTTGLMPTPQDPQITTVLRRHVGTFTQFQMTAFHDLVAMSGSLVIALAATENVAPANVLWDASRIDEAWQIEQWGQDDEATALEARRRVAFLNALTYFGASTE